MRSWECEDKNVFSYSYDANAGRAAQNEFLCLYDYSNFKKL